MMYFKQWVILPVVLLVSMGLCLGLDGAAYVDGIHLDSICLNIGLDLNRDGVFSPEDYTLMISGLGRLMTADVPTTSPLPCIDRGFTQDGYTDVYDIISWDWAIHRGMYGDCSLDIPLVGDVNLLPGTYLEAEGLSETSIDANLVFQDTGLLLMGKGSTFIGGQEYVDFNTTISMFDTDGLFEKSLAMPRSDGLHRFVDGGDSIYVLDSEQGILEWSPEGGGGVVLGNTTYQYQDSIVQIGIHVNEVQSSGRPILDCVVDQDALYVVPVVVTREDTVYFAAAKLRLTDHGYDLKQLYYDSNLAPVGRESPNLQGLREIEIDSDGQVYLLNAHNQNDSDLLWVFNNDGEMLNRHFLNRLPEPIQNPIGLCYDVPSERLYFASGLYDQNQPNKASLYGYDRQDVLSQNILEPTQHIEVANLQHLTAIASDQQGTLWVTGTTFTKTPEHLFAYDLPYALPAPRLAQVGTVGQGESHVDAISLYGITPINVPTAILWIGQ